MYYTKLNFQNISMFVMKYLYLYHEPFHTTGIAVLAYKLVTVSNII